MKLTDAEYRIELQDCFLRRDTKQIFQIYLRTGISRRRFVNNLAIDIVVECAQSELKSWLLWTCAIRNSWLKNIGVVREPDVHLPKTILVYDRAV